MLTSVFVLLSAALASTATAYTKPQGDNPSGNPISHPTLHEVVPAGTPYDITWQPTSEGSVTLLLLRGPSTNVVPLYPIVENIPNTGSYSWTPDMALEADTTGYGIQLIQDSNGIYQYSTQFGISGSTGSDSTSAASIPHIEYKNNTTNGTVPYHGGNSTVIVNSTCATACTGYHNTTSASTTVLPHPTDYSHKSNTTLYTTAVTTKAAQSTPVEVVPTGTSTALPVLSTGAASHLTISFLAGAAGLFAFVL